MAQEAITCPAGAPSARLARPGGRQKSDNVFAPNRAAPERARPLYHRGCGRDQPRNLQPET